MKPDWAVYGPAGAALGVGIFGMGALWASDPAFADELAAPAAAAAGGSGGDGGRAAAVGGSSGGEAAAAAAAGAVAAAAAVAAVAEPAAAAPLRGGSASAGGRRSPVWSAASPDCGSARSSRSRSAPAVPPRGVADLRERGMAVVPHGVRLSLGGAEPLDPARVAHLAACAAALDAPLVSEHVAFVRAGGREAGHLLPVPRTPRGAGRADRATSAAVQAELDVPLALEPIAALFDWPDDEYTEGEFLTALLERTGALLLLDVANVYANAVNRGQDPRAVLDAIPLERVAYVHVAGGAEHPRPGLYHDTHTDPVPAARARRCCERLVRPARHRRPPSCSSATAATRPRPSCTPSWTRSPAGPDTRRRAAPTPESRPGRSVAALAARQAALVAALVAGGPVPAGFDPDRLAAARRALVRKRAGAAAAQWPLLAASLGRRLAARCSPRSVDGHEPPTARSRRLGLARALHGRGELGAGAAPSWPSARPTLRPRRGHGGGAAGRPAGRPRVVVQLAATGARTCAAARDRLPLPHPAGRAHLRRYRS